MRYLALALLCLPAAAFAQEQPLSHDFLRLILPSLVEIIAVLLMAVLAWAAKVFAQKTGLTIEEKHRDALHSAIMSGVAAAAAKAENGGDAKAIVQDAIIYARASVPDAIKALKPGVDVLANLALAKLEAMLAKPAQPVIVQKEI